MTSPQALQSAFERIGATRMADMPLVNAALRVETVGFRTWEGKQVGVLIAPWSISIVVLPGERNDVRALALDQHVRWRFPDGEYEFMGGNEPECGPFHFCSLFSPPDEVADQEHARDIAKAVMEMLFPAQAEAPQVSRRALFTGVSSTGA